MQLNHNLSKKEPRIIHDPAVQQLFFFWKAPS